LILFAQQLQEAQGEFYFAENQEELSLALNVFLAREKVKTLYCANEDLLSLFTHHHYAVLNEHDDVFENEVTVTECEFLCARTGTVVMSSFLSVGRRALFANDILVIVAHVSQVVYDVYDALDALMIKYHKHPPSMITMITGPSRTADIEKQLVFGAHGSKRLIVFLHDTT